jgi:hypothetical protein
MTNSIRPLSTHTMKRPILAPDPAQQLSPLISVELVGVREVLGHCFNLSTDRENQRRWEDTGIVLYRVGVKSWR